MKIAVLLHSTSGNTKVVTRYAVSYLAKKGHECEIYDILKHKEPPNLDDIDLLCVSCPTMYFRPTFALERYIARLEPAAGGKKPAILLATCMGEPGAHFALLAEWLLNKDYVTMGAKFVLAPSNWPTHIYACRSLESTTPIGTWLCSTSRKLRPLWGSIWPSCILPDKEDRRDLELALDALMHRVERGSLDDAPSPEKLHRHFPSTNVSGRIFPREHIENLEMKIDETKCSRCGTCVLVCPVNVIRRDSDDEVLKINWGCTGCYSCFNRCPDGAIGSLGTPPGEGRYQGPPPSMREVFRPLKR